MAYRKLSGILLILLTILGFTAALPTQPKSNNSANVPTGPAVNASSQNQQSPQSVGTNNLPNLSLPKTVLSSVNSLVSSGGVIETSPSDLTLYNLGVAIHLLGGALPHDELLARDHSVVSSHSLWSVSVQVGGLWTPLVPASNNFTILGTNSSGTFVIRTMKVDSGVYSGTLRVTYRATSGSSLKWDLAFDASTLGHYKLVYDLWNLTSSGDHKAGSILPVNLGRENYTLEWGDVPRSFNTTTSEFTGKFSLHIDLGRVMGGSTVRVDPSIVGSSSSSEATGFSFQRKVFYEPKGGYYFVFYYDGYVMRSSNSSDGVNWSKPYSLPPGLIQYGLDESYLVNVFNLGQTVIVTAGKYWHLGILPGALTRDIFLNYTIGTITGPRVNWSKVFSAADTGQYLCPTNSPSICYAQVQLRFVNVGMSSTGQFFFSMNFVRYQSPYPTNNCITQYGTGFYSASSLLVFTNVNGVQSKVFSYGWEQYSSYPNNCYDYTADGIRSIILPADPQGGVRVVYQIPIHTFSNGIVVGTSTEILSEYVSSNGQTAWESPLVGGLGSTGYGNQEFSAVTDANYGTHVVYKWQNGTVSYSYRGTSSSNWTSPSSVFSGPVSYPTLTADYSTGDVYAFAVSGSSIFMRRKALIQSWQDESVISVVTGRLSQPTELTSNFYYTSTGINATRMVLVWTEAANSSFNVMFASLPASTIWSPYSYPSDPWDGNGLAPYGVYFSNLGEYISPSTGLLTLSQTDMSVPGRGLSLDLTRVYIQPGAFLSGAPYNYENYPWAGLGKGWQLNFPWMGIGNPDYIHLWNGEGYRIPLSFWTGTTGVFENHQGENFRLIRSSGGSIALYTAFGTSYNFDSVHRLTSIVDPTLANHINFTYSGDFIASIIDTVGRVFVFCYSAGQLKSINETSNSGSCSSGVGSVRGIVFTYNGSRLTNATDALGRTTTYQYDPTTGGGGWLISRVTYPTKWYTNYTYASARLGTEVTFYRIKLQLVGSQSTSSPIRQAGYSYSQGVGDQVTNSTVTSYSGTSIVSYTLLAFSSNGMSENITDANHNFLHGVFQQFGEDGEVIKETFLLSPTQGYSNYYSYDLWGSRIYSRESINPSTSWYHEMFNAYYNDGLPPGFNALQETFSENQGNAADNRWFTTSPSWTLGNGVFQGSDSTGNLFANFAWTNMSAPDVSIRARMFISNQPTNSTNLAGIFGRYSGGGTAKLSLGISISQTGSGIALLQEDGTIYAAGSDCSISNPVGIWYTLNLTIQGSSATGWVQPDGGQCQAPISLPFTSAGPPGSIGLEVTGLSARFDNITVTTARPPFATGNGFSNKFTQNGAPGSSIHNAVAGIAEFQNVTGTITPIPFETYYGYYPCGELNQTRQRYTSPSGEVWLTTARTYDSFGNLLTLTDSRGNTTALTYSASYKSAYLTSETQTLRPGSTQITSQYGYNLTTGTRLWSVDPNGYNTTYKYDILNRLTRISYPNNLGYTSNNYNDTGNYVEITNENAWKTRQVYDGLGRLTTIERFNKGAWYSNQTSTHNWRDQLTSTVDPMHNATSYQYDILGRLISTTEPNGNLTSTSYNDLSSWTRTTDENRVNKCYVYDRLGRLLSVVENASSTCQPGTVTNYYYDEIGNLAKVTTSTIQSTTYVYDNLNRLVKTNYPDHTNETYSYDNNGNVASKVDRKGTTSQYSYDSLNRPLTVTMLANPVSTKTYSYDSNGNILSLGNTNATIAYTYDSRNRVTSETYSVNGNFSLSVFPNKVSFFCTPTNCTPTSSNTTLTITSINGFSGPISLSYTPTNAGTGGTLLTGKNSTFLPSGGKVQTTITAYLGTQSGLWNWTITGRSGSSTASTVFMISQYVCYRNCPTSPIGGPTSPSQSSLSSPSGSSGVAASYRVGYAYGGELLSNITYPDNILLHYAYDSLGRAVNVSRISGAFVTPYANFAYNKNDQLTYIGYYNGFQSNYTYANYTYDSLGRTATITLVQPGKKPVTLLSLAYQYNRTSTVASVTGTVQTSPVNEQYKYDALNRLANAAVTSNGATTPSAYQYDMVGNRLSQTVNSQTTNYTYTATNNELKSSSGATSLAYSYDADGNLVSESNGYSYVWDASGDLVKVTWNGPVKAVYAYDGQGRRLESVESSTIFYAYLGTETLYENNTTSKTTTDYIYARGMRLGKLSSGVINYYHEDALGSTRLVTDPSGNVLFADGYQPFGQDNGTPTSSQTYRFTGKPVSQTTGLYYDYQRWYDPSIGRFISQDPFAGRLSNPQTLNPYVYAGNTPTTYTDPTGQFFILDTLIGAAVGAGVGYGWCVAATGGWTSSGCGEYALLGAGTGALAGTTWGLSLALEAGCEAEGCIPPEPTATTDPITTCLCPDTPTPTTSTTDPVPTVTTSAETTPTISNVARGNLGVDASIQDLGANLVGREVPVSSETFGNGRIDIYSNGPKSFIESKNVQNLYLTQENRLQLWKYEDAVGAENLQYDLHVNFVHPDFISELDRLNVAYRILPYIPSL